MTALLLFSMGSVAGTEFSGTHSGGATPLASVGLRAFTPGDSTRSTLPALEPDETGPRTFSVTNESLGLPGDSPSPAVFDPATGETFVAEYPDLLVVVGAPPLGVIASVAVGTMPDAIVVLPSLGELFVANSGSNDVSVVSVSSLQVVATIEVGAFPSAIGFDNATGEVAVANELSLNVTFLDPSSLSVVSSMTTGLETTAVAYDPGNQELYLTGDNASDNWPEVEWIDPGAPSVSGSILGIGGGSSIAYDPQDEVTVVDGGPVHCACFDAGAVTLVNASNGWTGPVLVPATPEGLVYDPSSGAVVAVVWKGSNWTGEDPIDAVYPQNYSLRQLYSFVGSCPQSLAIDAATDLLEIANSCGTSLDRLSLSNGTLVSVPVSGAGPDALLLDPANGDLLIADEYTSDLTVWSVSSGEAVGIVPVGSGPDAMAFDALSQDVYVANAASDNVSVFNGATLAPVASVPVGEYPDGLAFDPTDQEVWVANYLSNDVSAISTTSEQVVATVPNELGPIALAYDGGTAEVYVADSLNSSVGVIRPDDLTALSWDYFPGTPLSLTYDPGSGEIDVGELGAYESGPDLMPGLARPAAAEPDAVSLVGGVVAISDLSGAIVANPPTGDFPYAITLDPETEEVLTANLIAGDVGVFSAGTLQPVTSLPAESAPEALVANATTGAMEVADFGSDALTVLEPAQSLAAYPLNFSETGLTTGSWSVSLDGYLHTATAGTPISLPATNGTYSYTISGPDEYVASPDAGSVPVDGGAVEISVRFTPITPTPEVYAVTFTEVGACSVSWDVYLNGSLGAGIVGAPIAFQEPNGSYDFAVGPLPGCRASPSNGTLVVDGSPVSEAITYSPCPTPTASSGRWNPTISAVLLGAAGAIGIAAGLLALRPDRDRPRRPSS